MDVVWYDQDMTWINVTLRPHSQSDVFKWWLELFRIGGAIPKWPNLRRDFEPLSASDGRITQCCQLIQRIQVFDHKIKEVWIVRGSSTCTYLDDGHTVWWKQIWSDLGSKIMVLNRGSEYWYYLWESSARKRLDDAHGQEMYILPPEHVGEQWFINAFEFESCFQQSEPIREGLNTRIRIASWCSLVTTSYRSNDAMRIRHVPHSFVPCLLLSTLDMRIYT